jgi:hypothetical protein
LPFGIQSDSFTSVCIRFRFSHLSLLIKLFFNSFIYI